MYGVDHHPEVVQWDNVLDPKPQDWELDLVSVTLTTQTILTGLPGHVSCSSIKSDPIDALSPSLGLDVHSSILGAHHVSILSNPTLCEFGPHLCNGCKESHADHI